MTSARNGSGAIAGPTPSATRQITALAPITSPRCRAIRVAKRRRRVASSSRPAPASSSASANALTSSRTATTPRCSAKASAPHTMSATPARKREIKLQPWAGLLSSPASRRAGARVEGAPWFKFALPEEMHIANLKAAGGMETIFPSRRWGLLCFRNASGLSYWLHNISPLAGGECALKFDYTLERAFSLNSKIVSSWKKLFRSGPQ